MWHVITTSLFIFFLVVSVYPLRTKKSLRTFVDGVRAMTTIAVLGAAFTVCALPASVTAADGEGILTLARVIELAAASAPEVRLSTTRVAEAEAKLAGAQARTREDPKMDLAAGPRSGPERSAEVEAGFEIPFELGSRREKRIAVAQAGIQRERHATGDVRRQATAAAVGAY